MNTTTNDIHGAAIWDLDLSGWADEIEADGQVTVPEFEELVLAAAQTMFPHVRFVDHTEHNRLVRGNNVTDVNAEVADQIADLTCLTLDELREIVAR